MAKTKLIVIGGGAAGFFCAVNAARMNPLLEVLILEKSNKVLTKVRISGGGRCNVTHACFDISDMSLNYPRGGNFVKKMFHRFFTTDTINWFRERGVILKEENDGRMFPETNSSQTIIDCLLTEAKKYGVKIILQQEVTKIIHQDHLFSLSITSGETFSCEFLCIACGGYPKRSMFQWLTETGHTIEEPVPSLFTFNLPANPPDKSGSRTTEGHPITKLMGVNVKNARIKINSTRLEQTGPLLITHWGFSGPAVLKLSAWGARELKAKNWEFGIIVNWLPEYNEQTLNKKFRQLRMEVATQKLFGKNWFGLPQRLWDFLLTESDITPATRWADLPSREQNKFIKNLCACEFSIKGKTTFKEEFVTAGGIKTNEIDIRTMMSKKIPHLFFAGEIMDVDGITGGFNFQHAWTSSYIAANKIASIAN